MQGSLWKGRTSRDFPYTIRIPLECYSDDYENNNPLSSHKWIGKRGAVYINIGIFPLNVRAIVDDINARE